MLAELTHRCPLQCAYCSNPLNLLKADAELDTGEWIAILERAADIGVLQVHLSGGEPMLRNDLADLVAALARRGVYSNLITAGTVGRPDAFALLADAGLDHVQISFQGARAETTAIVSNMEEAHRRKLASARAVRAAGLPLTINAPVHRRNVGEVGGFIDLALELGAERLEIANVQYYGWALLNRPALMPPRDAVLRMADEVLAAQERLAGVLAIDFVAPDYYARFPKPCMGGWARDAFMVTPSGHVMPCHAAASIPGLAFDNAARTDLSDIWEGSSALEKFRGTTWMGEPCRSCARREIDFGGCRCQALMIAGDAAATDPACSLSPLHDAMLDTAIADAATGVDSYVYRRIGAPR